jgi:hypothetical protein
MRTLTRARIARIEALERQLPPEPEASPLNYALMSINALEELRAALTADGGFDPATLSPATLAEMEGAHRG